MFADVNEFLGQQYQPVIQSLDIYAASPANSAGSTPYYAYIESSFKQLSSALHATLSTSSQYLGQELFLAVRRVFDSHFMRYCQGLSTLCNLPIPGFGRSPSQAVTGMKSQIEEYCLAYCHLLNAMEHCTAQGLREYRASDWHNTFYPIGHARIKAGSPNSQVYVVSPEDLSPTGARISFPLPEFDAPSESAATMDIEAVRPDRRDRPARSES